MPSDNIVRTIRTQIQKQLLPVVSKRWMPQFTFGLEAFALKPFQSANGNARQVVANPSTAATKTERLLANNGLADQCGVVFDALNLVRESSYVNVDHSDMNRLVALVAAVQTRHGRALPCLVETTYSDRLPGFGSARSTSQTNRLRRARAEARQWQSFTGHYIDALQDFADRLGFWPRLVFDRGFGNETLVTHLQTEGATFYIRLKGDRLVTPDGTTTVVPTKHLTGNDLTVELYNLHLRIVRSPKNRRAKEPWYILTNDITSSRDKVVKIYYHRFEIEETFRDMKHIWELKRTRLNNPNSLKVILWLVSIGIALLYRATRPHKQPQPKKHISWLRQAYEQYQQAVSASLLLTG